MRMSDEAVIDRIRAVLVEWADEEPIAEPTAMALDEASTVMLVEAGSVSPIGRRTRTWLVTAAAAAAVVLVGLAAVATIRSDEPARLVDIGPAPSSITEIPVGASFGVRGVEVTEDAVWVTSQFDEQLYRVDPVSNRVVETFSIPSHIEGVRAVGGSLWLSRYEPNEVIRVDPVTGALTNRLAFDSQPSLTTDGERLWVIAERSGEWLVVEIDPIAGTEIAQIRLDEPAVFAAVVDDSVWVSNRGTTTVSRVDLASGRVAAVIDVGAEPRGVVGAAGSIWVGVNQIGAEQVGSVVRIDPAASEVTATVATGRWVHAMAADDDAVWVTNFLDGTVSVIDTESATLVATTPIGNRPGGVAIGHDSVWITPHRRSVLLRIDPSAPLEAAAIPDLARQVEVASGTVYVRCSGSGNPTVVLVGNQAEGVANAVVEARLSRETRVCAYEPVGIADPVQAGSGGPAETVAHDLAEALDVVGEHGPLIVVGEWLEGLDAQMFAASYRDEVVGLVSVNGVSADFLERVRALLPAEALEKFDQSLSDGGELQWLDESSAQVAATGNLGDLPLIVLSDSSTDPAVVAATSDPILTVAETDEINQLLEDTRRELAGLSTAGRLIVTGERVVTPADIVDAVISLLTIELPVATTVPVALPADSVLRSGLLQYLGGGEGGVSAVLEGDGVVEVVAIGVANSDGDLITADTAFYVGSISKVITATLVMMLVDEGRIDLDQPLSVYLPDIEVGGKATIRSLLSHRSGIPNYTDHDRFVPDIFAERARSWTPAELLAYADGIEASSGGVDEPHSYSNTNYVLLGMLIEQTRGTDLNSVLQTEISGPLGLTHTVFAGHGVTTPAALAAPYIGDPAEAGIAGTMFESIVADSGIAGMQYESVASSGFAAGALVSTPTDLNIFLGALLSGELVSPESLDEMIALARGGYGLGIETMDIAGETTWLGHGGSIIGYHSIMAGDPETGNVLVIVTNNETLDPAGFAERFLAAYQR